MLHWGMMLMWISAIMICKDLIWSFNCTETTNLLWKRSRKTMFRMDPSLKLPTGNQVTSCHQQSNKQNKTSIVLTGVQVCLLAMLYLKKKKDGTQGHISRDFIQRDLYIFCPLHPEKIQPLLPGALFLVFCILFSPWLPPPPSSPEVRTPLQPSLALSRLNQLLFTCPSCPFMSWHNLGLPPHLVTSPSCSYKEPLPSSRCH